MDKKVLEALIRQYLSYRLPVSMFSWQGGEPTLCGLSFFEEAVNLQMKYGRNRQSVGNSLQTNGTLLDKGWAVFLEKYKFLVGLSLDGPQELHNRYRGNSWEKVMKSARLLSDHNVQFNILTVLTREHEGKAEMLYNWFLEQGFHHLQFIPILEKDASGKGIAPFSISSRGYGDFLCGLFDVWWKSGRKACIRMFDSVAEHLLNGFSPSCLLSPKCNSYLVVEHDGTVYPCDFFVGKDTFLDNFLEKPLDEIFISAPYEKFARGKSTIPEGCDNCPWWKFCYGGCQKDRIDEEGMPAEKTYFCSDYKQFFLHTHERFQSLVQEITKNRGSDLNI